jgi:hypothetical protein
MTVSLAEAQKKPVVVVQVDELAQAEAATQISAWLTANSIKVLNVAGPREEKRLGIYSATLKALRSLFQHGG